ncbi:Mycothiol S-conjugate amidase [Streptomyces cyanogenus]|uniref:Mycothiol S-conjugate amidase n=2 Tax=Streptomyces cyanogenus TaxID=80860 RepID=A0ABX7TSN8_STRCY|nr:Mycothiol S-conjugate amidase [Streptomyces cyanogenus]
MVIAAHPDDAEFSFGATVGRLAAEGTRITYVVCTDGSQGGEDPDEPAERLTATRYEEQRAAARHLGVAEVVFLGFRDGSLTADTALRKALAREIRRHTPELVLAHQPLRSLVFPIGASHPDHLAAGEAALAAVYPDARNPRAHPELLSEGLRPHVVDEVWLPGHEHTDLFVDVGEYALRKTEAILCHRSQFAASADPSADIAWVTDRMRANGAAAGCAYAEAFKRVVTGSHAAPGPQTAPAVHAEAAGEGSRS